MTGRPTTIVAVDVDGVVNALPRHERDLAHFSRWERRRVAGYPLTVAGEVVDWLNRLAERGGEFHWATTWTPNRHLLDEAFGLPGDAPIAADPEVRVPGRPPGVSWKAAQIAALVEREVRPLVWMDDDAITAPSADLLDDLAGRLRLPMLAVPTDLRTGLRPEQMTAIDDFLDRADVGDLAPGLRLHGA